MNQIDKVFYSDPVMRSFDQIPTENEFGIVPKLTVLPAQKYKYTVPAAQEGNNIFLFSV